MSMKKLLLLAAAGTISATAFAGGAQSYSSAQAQAPLMNSNSNAFMPSAYVDVNGGIDYSGFKQAQASGAKFKSMSGNPFVFGGDFGYNFMPHLAIELGGTYFLKIQQTAPVAADITQWDVYAALKMQTQLMAGLNLFGKVGADYHSLKNTAVSSTKKGQFAPTFGAGLDYYFMPSNQNWRATLQWRRVAAISNFKKMAKNGGSPDQDLFTLGVGYVFPVS